MLATFEFAVAHEVKDVPSDLTDRLGHTFGEGCRRNTQRQVRWEVAIGDQGERDARFRQFLLGIVDEARMTDVLVSLEGRTRRVDLGLRLVESRGGRSDLVSMEGADRVAARPDRAACRGQRMFTRLGLRVELVPQTLR
ncbi:MAG: hypothetical protein GEU71_13180 [Actinobacteria bacterium]|nr:hypothetical protein [Actinomycetota bacterium]